MRLTRNIRKKQDYCEFELKKCRYQDIYGFEKYSELEENVDCDLTLAIDKLGQLEDDEEELKLNDLHEFLRCLEPNTLFRIMPYKKAKVIDEFRRKFIKEEAK